MIKSLLTSVALVATVLTANAQNYDLPLDNLNEGWGAKYDSETKTMTCPAAWKGLAWWLGEADLSDYETIVIECEPLPYDAQIVVQYNAEGSANSSGGAQTGSTEITCKLNEEYSNSVMQIAIQNKTVFEGEVFLKSAYIIPKVSYDKIPLPMDGNNLWAFEWTSLPEDALVRFTVTNSTDPYVSRGGWGIGGIFAHNNWKGASNSNDSFGYSVNGADGKEFYFELDIPKLNELCIADGEDLGGITWNIYNDCAITAVTALVPEGTEVNLNPYLLWEMKNGVDFGTSWNPANSFSVPTYRLADLIDKNEIDPEEGVTLVFAYTANEGMEYANIKLASNAEGWAPLEISKNLGNADQCINLPLNKEVYSLTLNAADLKTVMENGLRVQGYGATVTSVCWAPYDSYLDVPAGGLNEIADLKNVPLSPVYQYDLKYADMPDFGKGSGIVVFYNIPKGSNFTASFFESEETDAGDAVILTPSETNPDACYTVLALTDAQREAIALNGSFIHIEGVEGDITVTYTKGEEITGISDITVDENAPVEYFNLQGIKISADDATNGIFIRRQGGKSVKVAR